MNSFELCLPTKIVFGEGRVAEIGEIAATFGKKAFVLTYDEEFVKGIGFWSKVETPLKSAGVEIIPFFGIKSNPSIELAREAIAILKKEKPDVIIAVGGGSVIDTAKAISAGVKYEGDVWEIFDKKPLITEAMPIIAVVTIPATSSEMNGTTVMSNDELKRKDDYAHPILCPAVSVLDPELTYGIPAYQTAISAVDIVSHLLEGYISHTDSFVPMQNRYSEGMMRSIMECMDRLKKDPADKEARAMFMWIATYAWNGFYVCGIGAFEAVVHMLGHSLSALHDTPHGAAMAITIPAGLKYTLNDRVERYAMMARNVFDVMDDDDLTAAKRGIECMENWINSVGVKTKLSEIGITDLDALAKDSAITSQNWGLGDKYGYKECMEMFELCK